MSNKKEVYVMKDEYDSDNLVVANLSYFCDAIDSETNCPTDIKIFTTNQKYLFEVIKINGKVKFREIFTGFIAETCPMFFEEPFVENCVSLKEEIDCLDKIPKFSTLLLLNKINNKNMKDRLFEDVKPIAITDKNKEELQQSSKSIPVRQRKGMFYTDEEKESYIEESLERKLPPIEKKNFKAKIKTLIKNRHVERLDKSKKMKL